MKPTVTEMNGLTGEVTSREATEEELAEMASIAAEVREILFPELNEIQEG